ncbi:MULTISPECIES: SGNH/GDSL hydrolase family protein [Bradyrhizobium]|uniref:Lysophospholipase L1-like esterase n=1 Tax=Bradyrhizobium vignae TaxID=1549949 RepID=A0A2U3QCR9_9BRAD|nr:SGNH/GDSL hydrolase family protein [Bradyrhizobium vignae]MBP0112420.1 SGNH/GDSL hydrolase family protein [Bradyrhizobium vignae]RXG84294.1 SGNH/GDSL hydrolase family protein [Bradyrhizobium vignae]SPP99203.1 Lysophospholipase L1-like esterase [Bradyrhizobium vignae]
MSSLRPFCLTSWLAAPAAAVLLLLTPASQSRAQSQSAQATPAPAQPADPASASPSQTTVAARSSEQRGVTSRAIDKVKEVAKSAADIFSRVPCLPPKGGSKAMGSLPHVASKLVAGQPVVIVAFGSSSTAGFGASSPEFNYPNRLAAQLRRHYPTADITVVNAGVGGEDAPEMMKRLQTQVIDVHPDLVIWQVGTNAVLRNLDPAETAKIVEDGISRIQAAGGADIVLVDPQYSPAINQRKESAGKMVKLLGKVAELRHVGIFPRFEVMRDWHENQSIPVESFVIADGLHMNDWGYACFAQLLGDDIIRSVGQIRIGVNVPADVRTYRPM